MVRKIISFELPPRFIAIALCWGGMGLFFYGLNHLPVKYWIDYWLTPEQQMHIAFVGMGLLMWHSGRQLMNIK